MGSRNVGQKRRAMVAIRKWSSAVPTSTHWFCSWLHHQGWLKRDYTQNVDGLHLYPELDLPAHKVVSVMARCATQASSCMATSCPHALISFARWTFPNYAKKGALTSCWCLALHCRLHLFVPCPTWPHGV